MLNVKKILKKITQIVMYSNRKKDFKELLFFALSFITNVLFQDRLPYNPG